ncbi:sulfotransferase [Pararobbsia alpina]|uniref:Glycosyltransferase 2-like domain-containing protein n=1 Tax=Pararobbsia alpina TaxID=621374 RepID=A0A6S7C1C5_9BURK|nr:sulfotransferase [Pararobbsia alpina]CAB3778803.1 hypothetical protein LMG28138_00603 [Pararobbsia alpina]
MATVSILIPAFKPDYLSKALSSACCQTFKDIEILVADDTVDGKLRDIVTAIDDPRVHYFHHGFQDGLRNSHELWVRANGEYVKWLYDDDFLLPTSVEALIGALRKHPDSALAFHDRVFIDSNDNVTEAPPALISGSAGVGLLERSFLTQQMVGKMRNFIGEPSNMMLVRDKVDMSSVMTYRSHEFKFLTDAAMLLNLAERAPLVAVRGYLSRFRRHAAQQSGQQSPIMSASFYEWELLTRGEAATGHLVGDALAEARDRLKQLYAHAIGNLHLRELEPLLANLDELTESAPAMLLESPRFLADLANVQAVVKARMQAAPVPAPAVSESHAISATPEPRLRTRSSGPQLNGFIIGTGRSGTTMLASILNAHPQLCVPPEIQILFQYAGNGMRLHEVFEAGLHFGADANFFIQLVQQRCPHNLQNYFDYPSFFRNLKYPVLSLKELMGQFYAEIAKSNGKAICIEQTPWYGQRIDILTELFPRAKYIHMVRDGRDVAISFSRTPWWHKNIEHNLLRWAAEINKINSSCALMLKPEQVLVVRYEDFVEQTESEVKKICEFLGVQYDRSMLEPQSNIDYNQFGKSSAASFSSAAMTKWAVSKSSVVFKDSARAWTRYPDYDFSVIPEQVTTCLNNFGYTD